MARRRTAGIALGLDRLIMILRGTTNIRDVIAFPNDAERRGLIAAPPSPVDEKQLKGSAIRMVPPVAKG